MTERNSVILSSIVTALVCSLLFAIFLLTGVLNQYVGEKQNDAIVSFLAEVMASADKNDGKTSLTTPDGTQIDFTVTKPTPKATDLGITFDELTKESATPSEKQGAATE